MKKIAPRKLNLSRQTLRHLDQIALARANGGGYSFDKSSSVEHYSIEKTSCTAISYAEPFFCELNSFGQWCKD